MYEDFYPNFKREHEPYKGVLAANVTKADLKNNPNAADWPYNLGPRNNVTEQGYQRWLAKCLNSETQEYYLAKDEKGLPIKGTEPHYRIHTIVRMKTIDDPEHGHPSEEILLSKGRVVGHDQNGDEYSHPIIYPEMWYKTHFKFQTVYDEKRKAMTRQCMGTSTIEKIYELKFNEKNAKMLLAKKASDKIEFVVKDELTGRTIRVEPDVNLPKTFDRFMKPFEHLFNGDYITPQQKAELRSRAISEGIIQGSPQEVSNIPASPPKGGAYT